MARRNKFALLAILVLCCTGATWIAGPGKGSHSTGLASFSDTFPGVDGSSLGANWTKVNVGNMTVQSHAANASNTSTDTEYLYNATTFNTTTQYARVTLVQAGASSYPGVFLRAAIDLSSCHLIVFRVSEQSVLWGSKSGGTYADVQSVAQTITAGDVWGVTITGTGTSTVVRCWLNPTGTAPTSSTNWGGDTTPDVTMTNDPANPDNNGSGTYGGLSAYRAGAFVSMGPVYFGDVAP